MIPSSILGVGLVLATTAWATPIEAANNPTPTAVTLHSASTTGARVANVQAQTEFCLYNGRNCDDGTEFEGAHLEYPRGANSVFQLAPFNSVKFCGGSNANYFAACAQGASCYGPPVDLIGQNGACISANSLGSGSFDKILISS